MWEVSCCWRAPSQSDEPHSAERSIILEIFCLFRSSLECVSLTGRLVLFREGSKSWGSIVFLFNQADTGLNRNRWQKHTVEEEGCDFTAPYCTAPQNARGNLKHIWTHLYDIQITTKAAYFNISIQALIPCLSDHMLLPCGRLQRCYRLLLGRRSNLFTRAVRGFSVRLTILIPSHLVSSC